MRIDRGFHIVWLWVLLLATAIPCAAAEIPEGTSLVVDQAGVLTDDERAVVLARLTSIQESQRAQVGLLIANSTDGLALSDYALKVAEAWKLGRSRRDDGLLILIVPSPAGARLEVGYGLEGAIPDARASRWVERLLPAIREKRFAEGLERLIDDIDHALPTVDKNAKKDIFEQHPEWKLTFVLIVFSVFSIFPLFAGRWGGIPSAFLLAAFMGGAAWGLWESRTPAIVAAAAAFPLPLMWALNHYNTAGLRPWLRVVKAFGNFVGVLFFFSVISVFVCTGLSLGGMPAWPGFFFSGLLSVGLAVFLFPGKPAEYLMVTLRSLMHFVFVLVLAYIALQPFTPDPTRLAFLTAALVTALIATGLYLDSREHTRASMVLYGVAVLVALPFALLSLFLAAGGEDANTQLVHLATGGGSVAAIVALAVRVGLIAAVRVGLGGLFGGGGAGRSD